MSRLRDPRPAPRRRATLRLAAMVVATACLAGSGAMAAAAVETGAVAPPPATPNEASPKPEPSASVPANPDPSGPGPTVSPAPSAPTGEPPVGPLDPAPPAPVAPGVGSLPASGILPPIVQRLQESLPGGLAAPAGFGRFYPTRPWIFTAAPGTNYLDPREAGRLHRGIDAQGGARAPIFAVADGVVTDGTWGTTAADGHAWGNQVQLLHAEGFATRYAHLAAAPLVAVGESVRAGQLIGYMGGSAYGNPAAYPRHLHFEVTRGGAHVDPIAFLEGASDTPPEAPALIDAVAPTGPLLYELLPTAGHGFVSVSTGVVVHSSVFAAVDSGGDSADVFASEGGALVQLSLVDGHWQRIETGVALDATSLSGARTDTGTIELFAIEGGRLQVLRRDGSGWTKTSTGHAVGGTVRAVAMPGGRVHAMLQQSGYLYQVHPVDGGMWNVTDTRMRVGEEFDAVYTGGRAPDVMTIIDGQVHRIVREETTWTVTSTGLGASGPVAAVSDGRGQSQAITVEPGALSVSRIVKQRWAKFSSPASVPGPVDAVERPGLAGPVLYSIG